MRRDHDILMKGTDPKGGKWNFDPKEADRLKSDFTRKNNL